MPTLRVVHRTSAFEGREVVASDDVVRLGRSTNCQVLFDESEQTISRNHAELRWEGGALFLHPSPGRPIFRQGREVTAPTRVMSGDNLEMVRLGGPKIVVYFENNPADAEVTAPTLYGVAPVVQAALQAKGKPLAVSPQTAAAPPEEHGDAKTESLPALTPAVVAAAQSARSRTAPPPPKAVPSAPAAPSALEGADFDRAMEIGPGTEAALQAVPSAHPATNGAAKSFSWMEGEPPSIAPAPPPPAPPPAPEIALAEEPTTAPEAAPVPETPPAVREPTPEPAKPRFQRPKVTDSTPAVAKLEGVQIEREVTFEAPKRRKTAAGGSSYTPLKMLYDLIILGVLAAGGYLFYAGSQMIAYGAGGVALLLIVGRFLIFRGGEAGDEEATTPDAGFKKDALHTSAIDLSGIPDDAHDRVQRVAKKLNARGMDENVEVVDLVDDILICAEFLRASDCHIEPKEHDIRISLRIDGVVQDAGSLPKELEHRIANRFRIISKLDFAKADTPQDGRVEEQVRGKPMNLRVSVFPTAYGPKIVIRLLDSGAHALPPLEKLGIHPLVLKDFKRVLSASQGIVLFTGPTGSGKTTLMYSGLREIIDGKVRRNVVTLEDPIERLFPQINQTQVDTRRGLTFASGLRTILRQDPDVIMVGEIRDSDTAEIALRAGQTGHLLLSTLHTNSAAASFSRLMDMGVEPFLLASAITGVASSRLMRRLCPHCRVQARPPEAYVAQLQGKVRPDAVFYESRGCEECRNTGYAGRMLAFEFLTMNRYVADAVMARRSPDEIQKAATSHGMETILDDGLSKVKAGETSLEEVLRVLM